VLGESEVIGTVVGIVGTSCSDDAGESEAGRNETDGAFWTSTLEGAPDKLPSSPWTATKARHRVRSIIMNICVRHSLVI
jgi:hypothetical protein